MHTDLDGPGEGIKVCTVHPLGNMSTCTKSHRNQFNIFCINTEKKHLIKVTNIHLLRTINLYTKCPDLPLIHSWAAV